MPKYICTCGAKYRFPDEYIGKQTKCRKCGAVITLQATAPVDDGIIPFADEDSYTAEAAEAASRARQGALHLPPGSPGTAGFGSLDGGIHLAAPPATRSFAADVFWTFLFPTKIGDLFTFLGLWFVLVLAKMLSYINCIGIFSVFLFVAWLGVIGWYCAFRFSIIESAAGGDDNLPTPDIGQGFALDAISGIVRWLGSWIVVFLPAFAYRLYYYSIVPPAPPAPGGLPGIPPPPLWWRDAVAVVHGVPGILSMQSDGLDPFKILVIVGLFLWPFVVLCVGIGGFESFFRVDLMLQTVIRTLGPYFVTVALMVGASLLEFGMHQIAAGKLFGKALATGGAFGSLLKAGIFLDIVTIGVSIYADIVLMRLIGLYYHHFKGKFAWDWG